MADKKAKGATRMPPGMGAAIAAVAPLAPQRAAELLERALFAVPQRPVPPAARKHTPPGAEPFFVMAGESEVSGATFGTEDQPLALVAHGWGGSWPEMGRVIKALVGAGYRVATWDAPGHGRSTHGPAGKGRATLDEVVPAVDAVVGLVGQPRLVVAQGVSAAAILASEATRAGVAGYVLLAPQADLEATLHRAAGRLGGRRAQKLLDEALTRQLHGLSVQLPPAGPAAPKLLVVHDEGDAQVPIQESRELVEEWPGEADLMVTSGLGHLGLATNEQVCERVGVFASQLDDPAPVVRLLG